LTRKIIYDNELTVLILLKFYKTVKSLLQAILAIFGKRFM